MSVWILRVARQARSISSACCRSAFSFPSNRSARATRASSGSGASYERIFDRARDLTPQIQVGKIEAHEGPSTSLATADKHHDFDLGSVPNRSSVPQFPLNNSPIKFDCHPFRFEFEGGDDVPQSRDRRENTAFAVHRRSDRTQAVRLTFLRHEIPWIIIVLWGETPLQ